MRGYTFTAKAGETVARARAIELPVSPKKTYEVLNALRGRSIESARAILEDVIAKRRAIPFRRYNQETAHHTGTGPGRFPQKIAKQLLQLLANAEANAEYEGMDTDQLFIKVASCARGRIVRANMPRAHGRATQWNEQTTNVEIVVAEREVS
ncbi:MAG TPA: 50S ribosomal protein L22 [Thermoplasmata archaeon]|nr:50S ribosomal protein L22 [Thermoplasmata archaeon]